MALLKKKKAEIKKLKVAGDKNDPKYSDNRFCELWNLEYALEAHPIRFKSLIKKLKKNPDYQPTKAERETLLLALDYSIDMKTKTNEYLVSAMRWCFLNFTYERERPKVGHKKACQKAVEAMGIGHHGKGKQSLMSEWMASQIEYDYDSSFKSGMKSKDAIQEIIENINYKEVYGERLTIRMIAGILRDAGHKEVWDGSYVSAKPDN